MIVITHLGVLICNLPDLTRHVPIQNTIANSLGVRYGPNECVDGALLGGRPYEVDQEDKLMLRAVMSPAFGMMHVLTQYSYLGDTLVIPRGYARIDYP